MEVSSLTRIIEGKDDILGVSAGTIPEIGECAILTSKAAINIYSLVQKKIINTWSFPSNKNECLSSPAAFVNNANDMIAVQGGNTALTWPRKVISLSQFTKTNLKEYTSVLLPCGSKYVSVSEKLHCSILQENMDEVKAVDIVAVDEVLKRDISIVSESSCCISFLVRCASSYKFVSVQFKASSAVSIRMNETVLPIDGENRPIDFFYSYANGLVYILMNTGHLYKYSYTPSIQIGGYVLEETTHFQIIPDSVILEEGRSKRRKGSSTRDGICWNTCLTACGDKCFAYVKPNGKKSGWTVSFVQNEYCNTLCEVDITYQPYSLQFEKMHLFIIMQGSVEVCFIHMSSLTLRDMIKEKKECQYPVNSKVVNMNDVLKANTNRIMNEEDWKQVIQLDETYEEEESSLVSSKIGKNPASFVKKVNSFIDRRLEQNQRVISLSNEFIIQLVDKCILSDHTTLSPILQKLLVAYVDISKNPNILKAILEANDIETMLYYLNYISVIPEKDIIMMVEYCLSLDEALIRQFAERNGWKSDDTIRKRFLLFMGPQFIRIHCSYAELKHCLSTISLDLAYTITLYLVSLLIHLDDICEEETLFLSNHHLPAGKAYSASLIEWIGCMIDSNLTRIIINSKTDTRFVSLVQMIKEICKEDTELYYDLLPLKGVMQHIENKLPLPVSVTPVYSIEMLEI